MAVSMLTTSETQPSATNQQQLLDGGSTFSVASSRSAGSASASSAEEIVHTTKRVARPLSALELRLKDRFKDDLFEEEASADGASTSCNSRRSFQHEEEEESRVRRREESTCISSTRKRTSCLLGDGASSKLSSSTTSCSSSSQAAAHSAAASSLQTSRSAKDGSLLAATTTTSSSSDVSHFRRSSMLLSDETSGQRSTSSVSASRGLFGAHQTGVFLTSETDFSSPGARSIFREVGSEFAMLENALIDSTSRFASTTPFRLLQTSNRRPLSPLSPTSGRYLAIRGPAGENSNSNSGSLNSSSSTLNLPPPVEQSKFSNSLSELSARLNHDQDSSSKSGAKNSSERIKELLDRVHENSPHDGVATRDELQATSKQVSISRPPAEVLHKTIQDEDRKIFMSESIGRIDQRMSDLCAKLRQCKDSDEAIDLLKIIIQMVEKAWSVPVCGDDLGFKLCNRLREAGGLDFVLDFIQDTVENLMQSDSLAFTPEPRLPSEPNSINEDESAKPPVTASGLNTAPRSLKLDLGKINQDPENAKAQVNQQQTKTVSAPIRDNDSDILTSDLGLDSTSVESLSYALPIAAKSDNVNLEEVENLKTGTQKISEKNEKLNTSEEEEKQDLTEKDDLREQNEAPKLESGSQSNQKQAEIEEPAFLCARLLSQCLTSENRDYIVRNALNSVIRLACSFSTIKSSRIHRLLSRGSSSEARDKGQNNHDDSETKATLKDDSTSESRCEHSDVHAVIGTEILQHLFKHSEETCHRMISLGGLQAILYGCRSSNVEVLRHCASALANLALYGGPEGQQRMIEQKAHVWLFPLAFNKDDNVQYYACLAIVVLVANKEIEADVLKSSTLDLVEPFVLSHEPQRFAESTTAHIHGQSASWLRKLIPLLESKSQEARNLACFHFAMEAHIKREQSQTELFRQIGAVEPLRKVGSSPQAIASRFACQALRLIGEKEPHKLSQQVPLWTSEDVIEWVSQIGFERFRPAFVESRVDGDLLLQLDEDMLKSDIGIENGIIRRRFLRELTNLKRISDYSSIDKTGLCSMLTASSGHEFIQYVYPLLQLGVTRDTIHLFDCEQLLRECKVVNMMHQIKLAQALKDCQERQAIEAASQECDSQNGTDQKTLDVFVSYRRSTGSQLASLLKVHLQLRGFSVFIDVERLEAGKFDNNLLDSIKAAKNFIIVLSPSALDRCVDDHGCKDWVHKEIVAALASNCNIIPIIDNFHWPDPEQLPEDMRSIIYFNGVRWIHDYQDACIDKVERFIRGEINNPGHFSGGPSQLGSSTAQSSLQRLPGAGGGNASGGAYSISSPSVTATPSLGGLGSQFSPGQYQFSRPPPFDGYHHPLSYISQQLQKHSQSSQATASSIRN